MEYPGDDDNWEREQKMNDNEQFLLALPSCHLLTEFFLAKDEHVCCSCLCSAKMDNWHKVANVSLSCFSVCSQKGDFTQPKSLMDHICEKAKTDMLHFYLKRYVQNLFTNYLVPNVFPYQTKSEKRHHR